MTGAISEGCKHTHWTEMAGDPIQDILVPVFDFNDQTADVNSIEAIVKIEVHSSG